MWPQIGLALLVLFILAVVAVEGSATGGIDAGVAEYGFLTRDKDFGLADDEQQGGAGLIAGTVRTLNGNMVEFRQDLSFASPHRSGLFFAAYYNSRSKIDGSLGFGWTHTYSVFLDASLESGGKSYLKIVDASGCGRYFKKKKSGSYKGILFERSKVKLIEGEYIWHRLDGSQYGFSDSGRLRWIQDPIGNRLIVGYDDEQRLETVEDLASGRSLTFNYNDDDLIESISGPITEAVGDGIWVEFGYDDRRNLTDVIYADDAGVYYEYNDAKDAHNLTAKHNGAEHKLAGWGYDRKDRCISHFSPKGTGVSLKYVNSTRVDVTDAYGVLRTYSIGKIGDRKRVIAMQGLVDPPYVNTDVIGWQYDSKMNLVQIQDAGGIIHKYQDHDSRGNAQRIILAFGTVQQQEISFSYHPRLNVPMSRTQKSVLGSGNKVTTFDYDDDNGDGQPNENPTNLVYGIIETGFTKDETDTTVEYEYISAFSYNTLGQLESSDGPRLNVNDVTSFYYYANGDLDYIDRPLIGATGFDNYDSAGQVGTVIDVNGKWTHFDYDGRGKVVTITHGADGSANTSVYVNGLLDTSIDEDGVETGYEYDDDFERLFRIYDIENNYIQYRYDNRGNLRKKSRHDSTGKRFSHTRWKYHGPDIPGKLWKKINFNGSYTEYRYYANGNLKKTIDAENHITRYKYDALNRLTTVTQTDKKPNDTVTFYKYDGHGNLKRVIDAGGLKTRFKYDDMGRVVYRKSADTGKTLYAYDEAGNLVQKTDAKKNVTRYVYDALNRLTHIHVADAAQDIEYSYDEGTNGIGRRTGMSDPSGATSFGYDARGRLVSKTTTVNGNDYTLNRVFSPGRRLKTVTYPSGHVIDLTSRHADTQKIKDITASFTYYSLKLMSNLSYNPFSGAKEMDTGFGGSIYNEQSECACLERSNPGASMEQTYTYDNNRNLTTIRGTNVSWYNQDFFYDNLNRLKRAIGSYGNVRYKYDRVGNRLFFNDTATTEIYTYYRGTNRLKSVIGSTSIDYSYDKNGNPTQIGNRTYQYNHNNRLVKVKEGSSTIADYTYNGLGQRVIKKAGDKQTVFHYDFDGQIIAEGKPDGTYTTEYIYLGNTRLAMVDIKPNDALVYYYANNYLGTPFLMTDERGVVVWEAEYKPFGEAKLNPNSKVVNNFRFPGQYFDKETGLHYNYHRYYNPKTGRYLTPDPIGLDGGINPNIFATNNPINWFDIDGAKPIFNSGVCPGGEIDRDALLFDLYGIDVDELKKQAIQQQLLLMSAFFPSGGYFLIYMGLT
jgi:RHS repeat-associated protein